MKVRDLEGRPSYVVPMVMLTEGVHSGSNGPVYYPADELARTAADWNGRPVVVYHPRMDGVGVSAGNPDITNRYKIGVIFNSVFDGKRLTAEAWIDKERVAEINQRVLDAIIRGRKLEVSTGLNMDWDTENMVNGVPTARNYRPDHLAILPDKTGACSLAAGCGLMRNEGEAAYESPLMLPAF